MQAICATYCHLVAAKMLTKGDQQCLGLIQRVWKSTCARVELKAHTAAWVSMLLKTSPPQKYSFLWIYCTNGSSPGLHPFEGECSKTDANLAIGKKG